VTPTILHEDVMQSVLDEIDKKAYTTWKTKSLEQCAVCGRAFGREPCVDENRDRLFVSPLLSSSLARPLSSAFRLASVCRVVQDLGRAPTQRARARERGRVLRRSVRSRNNPHFARPARTIRE
jgi:hypothetical protein